MGRVTRFQRNGGRKMKRTKFSQSRKKFSKNNVVKHGKYGGKTGATTEVVTYQMPRQMPFPPRYRTKFTSGFFGNVAAGTISGLYFAYLNSAYLPFTGGGWPNPSQALTTIVPAGYTALVNANLYRSVRVHGSRIEVEFLPQALTDTVISVVTPSSINTGPASVNAAIDQPYSKQLFMSSSKMNGPSGSKISNYISVPKFLGVTNSAIQNDLSGNYNHAFGAAPGIPLYWVFNWSTPDLVATAVALEYRVKITIYCELYNDTLANNL